MESIYDVLRSLGYTHPIHPPMTYIPLGMVTGGLIFALLAVLPRFDRYAATARHCITLGFLGVFPTMLLGYMDWQHFYGGRLIFPIQMKIILAAALTLLLGLAVWLYYKLPPRNLGIIAVHVLSFATIVGIGYFGGELVFGGRFQMNDAAAETEADSQAGAAAVQGKVTYADIAPVFEQNCTGCHSSEDAPSGLQLDTYAALMDGSENGPVVVSGKPRESELVKRIRGTVEPRMPLNQPPLPEAEIQRIAAWIRQGAGKE